MQASLTTGLSSLSFTRALQPEQLRLRSRSMMLALSHAIEEHAAAAGPETHLIATFQRLSLFRTQVARYARLAPRLAGAFALGVPDATLEPIPGVSVLPIESDWPLAHEWVVIASGPTCCVALQSYAVDGFQPEQRSRQFAGRWSTEPAEIDALLQRFFLAIELPAPPVARDPRAGLHTATAIRKLLARRA